MRKHDVIAEMIDVRNGGRLFPGDTLETDDQEQVDRLIGAGCLSKDPLHAKPVRVAAPEPKSAPTRKAK